MGERLSHAIDRLSAEPETEPVLRPGLSLHTDALQLIARRVDIDGTIGIEELRLSARSASVLVGPGGELRVNELDGTLVVTEASLNAFLAGRSEDMLRRMQVAMMTGKVRISGRYGIVPFTFTAVPEIEGGARLRLDPRQISLVGVPLPGVGAQMIGDRINAQLAQAFDITRYPLAMRLTGLAVEPGRIILSATASIDARLHT